LDGYVQVDGGDFWLATTTDHRILFAFNNTASTNYADKTGFYLSGSVYGTSSWATDARASLIATSASWISASAYIINADTASYLIPTNDYSLHNLSASNHISASSLLLTSPYSTALQVGTSLPIYLSQGWPAVSFNTYYDGGWVFGPGSSNKWAAYEQLDATDGKIDFYFPSAAGNAGGSWGTPVRAFSISHEGMVQMPRLPYGVLVLPSGSSNVTSSNDLTPFNASASFALTSSHAMGIPTIKSGVAISADFQYRSPRTASIVFSTPFGGSYTVTVTGGEARIWTVEDITSASFTINSNSDSEVDQYVYWQAISIGEFYSTGPLPS
jgi:hypothetical protein